MDCVTDLAFMSDPACLFGKGNLFLGEPCACCKGVHLWNFQTFVISLLRSFLVPALSSHHSRCHRSVSRQAILGA